MTKTFKDYYNDPEFAERHRQYTKVKVPCECGKSYPRGSIARHKKTNLHKKQMDKNPISKQLHDAQELIKKLMNEKDLKVN
mgnify:FL=1